MDPRPGQPGQPGWPAGQAGRSARRPGQPAGQPALKILKNDVQMKDSRPGTFIFEKGAKNYVRGFNASF